MHVLIANLWNSKGGFSASLCGSPSGQFTPLQYSALWTQVTLISVDPHLCTELRVSLNIIWVPLPSVMAWKFSKGSKWSNYKELLFPISFLFFFFCLWSVSKNHCFMYFVRFLFVSRGKNKSGLFRYILAGSEFYLLKMSWAFS